MSESAAKDFRLTLASGDYAHTRQLATAPLSGPSGETVEIGIVTAKPGEIFRRALGDGLPFDVSEMSLATAYVLASRGERRFIPLPVFPSRMFRHGAFYVAKDYVAKNGADPRALKGKRIGVIRYGMTAAVWARALLATQYGIAPQDLEWWIGEPQFFQPAGIELNVAQGQAALESMLAEGKLDCLFSVTVPDGFSRGQARRLFPDFAAAERALFAQTGYVPIMHTVLLRRTLAEAHPWLAQGLMERFTESRDAAMAWVRETGASSLPLPFQHAWAEEAVTLCGGDPWPYGLEANRPCLEAFGEAMHAQGLTSRRLSPQEVFGDI